MSSMRKALPRREHKERSQLSSRSHLGLLEKKKDYVIRSTNYKQKQKTLKALKLKAQFKNKDEFYFAMINSKLENGVHKIINDRNLALDPDLLKLLKSQDLNYISLKKSINLKQLLKIQESKQIINNTPSHTIFVDDENMLHDFDPAKHFQTDPSNLNNVHNRVRIGQNIPQLSQEAKDEFNRLKKQSDLELAARKKRHEILRKAELEMTLQKNLMGKAPKKQVGVDKNGLPIFKWKAQRSR